MKFFKHKLMVLLALLSLIFQLASPLVIYGEPAMKQKEQIENSIEEYEKTHKEIMALKPIELGSITKWILNRISDLKKGKSNIVNTCKLETPDEKTARDKRERLERYVVQIEKANADLKKVQEKSSQTMKYLRSGNIEKAARTDPTSVYENMDKSTSAVAIYQQALKEAGTSLLQGAEALSETATILGALALLCTGISIGFAPAAAVAAPIATAAEAGAKAAGIGAIALKTAGKTLMGAAEKAIADDQQFVALLSQNTFVAGLEYGMSKAVSKGISNYVGDYMTSLANTSANLDAPLRNEEVRNVTGGLLKDFVGDAISPAKSAVFEAIENDADNHEEEPLPAAKPQPGLGF